MCWRRHTVQPLLTLAINQFKLICGKPEISEIYHKFSITTYKAFIRATDCLISLIYIIALLPKAQKFTTLQHVQLN